MKSSGHDPRAFNTPTYADGALFGFMQSQLHAVKNEFTRKRSQTRMRLSLAAE
jgi:hypothetical protein